MPSVVPTCTKYRDVLAILSGTKVTINAGFKVKIYKIMRFWFLFNILLGVPDFVIKYTSCAYYRAYLYQISRCVRNSKWYKKNIKFGFKIKIWKIMRFWFFFNILLGVPDSIVKYTSCAYNGAYLYQISKCASNSEWYKSYHQWIIQYSENIKMNIVLIFFNTL